MINNVFWLSDAGKLMGGMLVGLGTSCKRKAFEISSVIMVVTPGSLRYKRDLLYLRSLQTKKKLDSLSLSRRRRSRHD